MQITNNHSSLNPILESDEKQPLLSESIQTEYEIDASFSSAYGILEPEHVSNIETYHSFAAIENEKDPYGVKLSQFAGNVKTCVGNVNEYVECEEMNSKNSYVERYLLENINRNGKAPYY